MDGRDEEWKHHCSLHTPSAIIIMCAWLLMKREFLDSLQSLNMINTQGCMVWTEHYLADTGLSAWRVFSSGFKGHELQQKESLWFGNLFLPDKTKKPSNFSVSWLFSNYRSSRKGGINYGDHNLTSLYCYFQSAIMLVFALSKSHHSAVHVAAVRLPVKFLV